MKSATLLLKIKIHRRNSTPIYTHLRIYIYIYKYFYKEKENNTTDDNECMSRADEKI